MAAQRGYAIKLARKRTCDSAADKIMKPFTPCRPNAVSRIPDENVKANFVKQINDERMRASQTSHPDRAQMAHTFARAVGGTASQQSQSR